VHPVVYHPQPLRLELWIERVRAAEFTVRYEVFDGARLVARAATRCVTFDFGLDRPRRLTAEERGILLDFADDPAPPLVARDDAPVPTGTGNGTGSAEGVSGGVAARAGRSDGVEG
jgi:hypothetical protein